MSSRGLAGGVAATVLMMPGAVLLGVATLIAPGAAGSAGCLFNANTVNGPLSVVAVPRGLSAKDAEGRAIALDQTQIRRAASIIAAAAAENAPPRAQLIAIMAALTESSLRVLSNVAAVPDSGSLPHDGDGHDHDSLGLFQMRPSAGWGSTKQLMDPVWSTRAFLGGPDGPNHGSSRGLLDQPHWASLTPGAAAQAVEGSRYPDRYAVLEPVAERLLSALSGRTGAAANCHPPATSPTGLPPGFAGAFIADAGREIGLPYVWGGGSFAGPTGGGFDCSGLVLFAAFQASHGRIRLPHDTATQVLEGTPIQRNRRQPGDLIFFTYPGNAQPHHVAIYLGGDRILQAPKTGEDVRYGDLAEFAGQQMTVRRLSR